MNERFGVLNNHDRSIVRGPMKQSTKDKISAFRTGTTLSQSIRDKLSLSHRGKTFSAETRKRMSDSHNELWLDRIRREKHSKVMKELWKDPEYARSVMHRRTPSKPELMFIEYCRMLGLGYQFVGDGKLIIDGKNPDFVDSTGKKLVEIWGEFFHKGQNPQDRIKFFADRGFECQVIWANELKQLFRDVAQTNLVVVNTK